MASENPQVYYENEERHGEYVYISLEELVNNFMLNYTGDGSVLGNTQRSKVIYQLKKGIQQFSFNALKEVKAVELELGETLDIILPPDYVSYVRISYVNPETGELMVLSSDRKNIIGTAYLQDHNADILFDDNGFILDGTTYHSELNDVEVKQRFIMPCEGRESRWSIDTSKNANGSFYIDTRLGKIHFSSDNASRVILLEYISDGLEFSLESDIKVNKLAEIALYNWCQWNLIGNKKGAQEYVVRRFKNNYDTSRRNATIDLMNLRVSDIDLVLNAKRKMVK